MLAMSSNEDGLCWVQ